MCITVIIIRMKIKAIFKQKKKISLVIAILIVLFGAVFWKTTKRFGQTTFFTIKDIWVTRDDIADRILSEFKTSSISIEAITVDLDKLSGDHISNQWRGDRGNFVLVTSDSLSFRESPSPTASIRGTLKYTHRVRAVDKTDVSVENGKITSWYLVSDERGKTVLGWVPAWGLVFSNQFVKKHEWSFGPVVFYKGQLFAQYDIKSDGSFSIDWKAKGNGLTLEGNDTGHFYEYDDILWAKKYPHAGWEDFFIVNKDGHLNQEYRFRNDDIQVDGKIQ